MKAKYYALSMFGVTAVTILAGFISSITLVVLKTQYNPIGHVLEVIAVVILLMLVLVKEEGNIFASIKGYIPLTALVTICIYGLMWYVLLANVRTLPLLMPLSIGFDAGHSTVALMTIVTQIWWLPEYTQQRNRWCIGLSALGIALQVVAYFEGLSLSLAGFIMYFVGTVLSFSFWLIIPTIFTNTPRLPD